jgi:hypothetical protein
MSKHRKGEWEALKEQLAQTEFEREDARHSWAQNRERADRAERRVVELESAIRTFKAALVGLLRVAK